ncbi:MAG TPA: dienelactone hydrolase family protein [Anaerolineales bacterium]|nr:dienelactone hydrolase family protein [Anaerolineales bacterium]
MEQMTFRELTDKLTALYTRSKYAEALELVEQNAPQFPEQSARTTFWRMCLLSLCGRADDTISVFRKGLDVGLWWRNDVFNDTDLNAVRDLPEFRLLMTESQEKYEEERLHIERDHAVLLPERPSSNGYPLVIALHGRNGNKDTNLAEWEIARRNGWLVLLTQSTQPLFPASYCWDDSAQGIADLLFYYEQVSRNYSVDPRRVILAGFSQGSGMAIQAALSGKLSVHGFIGIASWWADPKELAPQTEEVKRIRGYFIAGEKDHTFERAREIRKALQENQITVAEELHPELAHEFPHDFEQSFDQAIDFIFKEHE